MLFESAHVRVTAEYGTATLWLGFPGGPVNAFDLARLRELDAALASIDRNPFVRIVVVRSAKPAGFCAGLHPAALESLTHPADRAAFAWAGQQVFARLAGLNAVTVAFIDGPCLGAGLELALACDHRLCVARPTTHLGFPDPVPCFGGTARLRNRVGRKHADELLASGRTLSGREARALGLVDHAFCERRAKIELRTFLDRLEQRPWRTRLRPVLEGLADERRAFSVGAARRAAPAEAVPLGGRHLPAVIGLVGDDADAARIAADAALNGREVVVCGTGAGVFAGIAIALARGFITPLEADQARARVRVSLTFDGFDRAGLVLLSEGASLTELSRVIRPRCRVAVAPDFTPALLRRAARAAA